jgi:hypothetical protein
VLKKMDLADFKEKHQPITNAEKRQATAINQGVVLPFEGIKKGKFHVDRIFLRGKNANSISGMKGYG